jgi:hypothetical protein
MVVFVDSSERSLLCESQGERVKIMASHVNPVGPVGLCIGASCSDCRIEPLVQLCLVLNAEVGDDVPHVLHPLRGY